jgi:hypothetical protein
MNSLRACAKMNAAAHFFELLVPNVHLIAVISGQGIHRPSGCRMAVEKENET